MSASVMPGAAAAPPAGAFPTVAALLRTLGVAWTEISQIQFSQTSLKPSSPPAPRTGWCCRPRPPWT